MGIYLYNEIGLTRHYLNQEGKAMENKYLEQFKTWTEEDLLNYVYFVSGNEEMFWLAVEMLNRADIARISGKQTFLSIDCGKAAQKEIDGLINIGFMDSAHKAILFQYTGLVSGNVRY